MKTRIYTMKKIKIFIICLVILLLSGCSTHSQKGTNATESGSIHRLTLQQVFEEERQGIFVMNGDNSFSPVMSRMPGFKGSTSSADPKRYLWYTDNEADFTSLIPVVTPETPLVAIYRSNSALPSYWYLEKYEDRGYTVGAHFFKTSNGKAYIDVKGTLSGSSAEKAIAEGAFPDSSYQITKINELETFPLSNIDTNLLMYMGLQKDKLYTFYFYQGTVARRLPIYADTRVFQSVQHIELTAPIKRTDGGYFIINLPVNLTSGYYYICDIGLFEYRENVEDVESQELERDAQEEPSNERGEDNG